MRKYLGLNTITFRRVQTIHCSHMRQLRAVLDLPCVQFQLCYQIKAHREFQCQYSIAATWISFNIHICLFADAEKKINAINEAKE